MSVRLAEHVTIRFAAPADERRLAGIDEETWAPDVQPGPKPPSGVFFRQGCDAADTLVALLDGEVAGYLVLAPPTPRASSAHVQMVRGLAVDPAFERRGIGRGLLERAVEVCVERGARKLSLRVLGSNDGARRLYGSTGFDVEGVLRRELVLDGREVDDVLMARRVAP